MTDPKSHSLDVTVLKDKSGSDPAQVPASATIRAFQPGVTVKTGVTIPVTINDPDPVPTTVEVYDAWSLRSFDTLAVNSSAANQLMVGDPPPPTGTQVSLLNLTQAPIALSAGDRLIRVGAPIQIFKDRHLTVVEPNLQTDASTGRARGYVSANSFDWVAEGAGITPRAFADVRGRPSPGWVNATCFPTIQEAVDFAAHYKRDVVYIPAGVYGATTTPAFNPPLVLPQNRNIRIVGDGPRATVLKNRLNGLVPEPPDVDLVHVRAPYQTIEALSLEGYVPILNPPGTAVGIRIRRGLANDPIVYRVHIRDVEIVETPSWAIMVDEAPVSGVAQIAVWGLYENLEIDQHGKGGEGIYFGSGGTTTQYFRNCAVKNFSGNGVLAKQNSGGLSFVDCIFECSNPAQEYVKLEGTLNAQFLHCWFEGRNVVAGPNYHSYLHIDGACHNVLANHCLFAQKSGGGSDERNMKAVQVETGARGVVIADALVFIPLNSDPPEGEGRHIVVEEPPAPLSWDDVRVVGGILVDGNPTPRKLRVFDGLSDLPIGPSTRLRLPRLTSAEIAGLANPTTGEMLFNVTTGKAQVYDGGSWRDLW